MKASYRQQRDSSSDILMKSKGYRFVVTRNGLSPVYSKTACEGADLLRRNAKHAPAALWRI